MSPEREDAPKGPALKAPSVRLFVLLARRARRAVVFRRGPSRQVLLLSITYRRARPGSRTGGLDLQMRITGFYEREGPYQGSVTS
jgi:hypothetical protein